MEEECGDGSRETDTSPSPCPGNFPDYSEHLHIPIFQRIEKERQLLKQYRERASELRRKAKKADTGACGPCPRPQNLVVPGPSGLQRRPRTADTYRQVEDLDVPGPSGLQRRPRSTAGSPRRCRQAEGYDTGSSGECPSPTHVQRTVSAACLPREEVGVAERPPYPCREARTPPTEDRRRRSPHGPPRVRQEVAVAERPPYPCPEPRTPTKDRRSSPPRRPAGVRQEVSVVEQQSCPCPEPRTPPTEDRHRKPPCRPAGVRHEVAVAEQSPCPCPEPRTPLTEDRCRRLPRRPAGVRQEAAVAEQPPCPCPEPRTPPTDDRRSSPPRRPAGVRQKVAVAEPQSCPCPEPRTRPTDDRRRKPPCRPAGVRHEVAVAEQSPCPCPEPRTPPTEDRCKKLPRRPTGIRQEVAVTEQSPCPCPEPRGPPTEDRCRRLPCRPARVRQEVAVAEQSPCPCPEPRTPPTDDRRRRTPHRPAGVCHEEEVTERPSCPCPAPRTPSTEDRRGRPPSRPAGVRQEAAAVSEQSPCPCPEPRTPPTDDRRRRPPRGPCGVRQPDCRPRDQSPVAAPDCRSRRPVPRQLFPEPDCRPRDQSSEPDCRPRDQSPVASPDCRRRRSVPRQLFPETPPPPNPPEIPGPHPPYVPPPPHPDRPRRRTFQWECDRLLALWGGLFTSPHSVGHSIDSGDESQDSVPSTPGEDFYWPTSSEEGYSPAGSGFTASDWGTESTPPSSLESGMSTPGVTPPDMSPLPLPEHPTYTHVIVPNLQAFLLIIDYFLNNFCEDRKTRMEEIRALIACMVKLQGNELQDSLLTLRDLVIRRGRMLPELNAFFKELEGHFKDLIRQATHRHCPQPNLNNLHILCNKPVDPHLSQRNYIKILSDLQMFSNWAYRWSCNEIEMNNELQSRVEDLMCNPENLICFVQQYNGEFEENSVCIDRLRENLRDCQQDIDRFLVIWRATKCKELNKPYPNDMMRRFPSFPDLSTPELEAGVTPGALCLPREQQNQQRSPGPPCPPVTQCPHHPPGQNHPPGRHDPGPKGPQGYPVMHRSDCLPESQSTRRRSPSRHPSNPNVSNPPPRWDEPGPSGLQEVAVAEQSPCPCPEPRTPPKEDRCRRLPRSTSGVRQEVAVAEKSPCPCPEPRTPPTEDRCGRLPCRPAGVRQFPDLSSPELEAGVAPGALCLPREQQSQQRSSGPPCPPVIQRPHHPPGRHDPGPKGPQGHPVMHRSDCLPESQSIRRLSPSRHPSNSNVSNPPPGWDEPGPSGVQAPKCKELDKPYPNDMMRRFPTFPDLSTLEIDAGVAPGALCLPREQQNRQRSPGPPCPPVTQRPQHPPGQNDPIGCHNPGPKGPESHNIQGLPPSRHVPNPNVSNPPLRWNEPGHLRLLGGTGHRGLVEDVVATFDEIETTAFEEMKTSTAEKESLNESIFALQGSPETPSDNDYHFDNI